IPTASSRSGRIWLDTATGRSAGFPGSVKMHSAEATALRQRFAMDIFSGFRSSCPKSRDLGTTIRPESSHRRTTNLMKTIAPAQPAPQTRRIALLLSALCFFGLPRLGVLADTFVSGSIAGQTWTKANSPYRVVGDIQVAVLTINPGV